MAKPLRYAALLQVKINGDLHKQIEAARPPEMSRPDWLRAIIRAGFDALTSTRSGNNQGNNSGAS